MAVGPTPYHNGGKMTVGADGYLYAVVGDTTDSWNMADNENTRVPPDDRSSILRIDRQTCQAAPGNPFYGINGLSKTFACGIRNSFGMDFDPVTNNSWFTENDQLVTTR